ncbi:MAG: RICIN domain-containing protein [Bacteroidaceae bacterium]|nr:RICIN domain-containing protein [Bacteroidaceae bacterium]
MRHRLLLLATALVAANAITTAQVPSGATNAVATAVPHTTVPFRIDDPGTKLPDITWGLDLAWIDEGNIHRGVNFAGADLFDIVRLSFQTTDPVTDGQLTSRQKTTLNKRINLAKKYLPGVGINLNSDQEAGIDEWYHVYGSDKQVNTFSPRWAALIAATKAYAEEHGMKVLSVSPFNEPDYGEGQTWGWQQGSKAEMHEICRLLREDELYAEAFKDVLLCGGNTLNDDYALPWYNYSKKYLDEGNTHQLAGTFDNFAKFYQQVKADGKVGVDDELHNTMECMVGSEYGMTKGIWWGTCEHTRSQFMKASQGHRLGYGEHRANWTAASVYRHPDGKVQAFGGASERQAVETTFRLLALDHDVFYNGAGPTREYLLTIPGGKGYQSEQPNAETLVNVQGTDDIMPALPTTATNYKFINRHSGFALSAASNNVTSGASLSQQRPVKTNRSQHWTVAPLNPRNGGDFCYYKITNANNARIYIDVLNWSLDDSGDLIAYAGGFGTNEQWCFEYAGDGWFYIRSRHSGLYVQVQPGTDSQMKAAGRNINQGRFTGEANQQWRLVPENIAYNSTAPAAPTALTATPQPASIALAWTAPDDADLSSYTIQRSDDGGTTWRVINKDIKTTEYVDNTACDAVDYQYRILAQDESLNHSEPSEAGMARPTSEPALIMHLTADADLSDASPNGNHAAIFGDLTLQDGHFDQSVQLNGSTDFIQLPATIANSRDMTFATWINIQATSSWQRIFDFGIDTDHYCFLTPRPSVVNRLRLAIKNGGSEQIINATATHSTKQWIHVAVTFGEDAITIYLNGQAAGNSTTITDRPADFRPVLNYIGRSQFTADPMLNAAVDDVRIYNYALTADEVAALYDATDAIVSPRRDNADSRDNGVNNKARVFDMIGRRVSAAPQAGTLSRGIYIINGRKVVVN